MKILVLDNYDSFTYNLVHLVQEVCDAEVDVKLNDQVGIEQVNNYDRIILSPGPGLPSEAGILIPLVKRYAAIKPILGVCLGHQAIAEAFGGKLLNLPSVFHGRASSINFSLLEANYKNLFAGLPAHIQVARYHSWVVDKEDFPDELMITAIDEEGTIMALQHKTYNVTGVQFHPESVLTPHGAVVMKNWIAF